MKRVILLAAATLVIGSAQAQFKPDGVLCLEVSFNPLSVSNTPISTPSTFPIALDFPSNVTLEGISAKYFVSSDIELRLDLGFGFGSSKNTIKAPAGATNNADEVTKGSLSIFGIDLGMNYHFSGTERISPYVGALLGCVSYGAKSSVTGVGHIADNKNSSKGGAFGFQFAVATGFNFYIVKGLYLGAEVGLGLEFDKPTKTKSSVTVSGVTTNTTVDPTSSDFNVGFMANPAIRLGWSFGSGGAKSTPMPLN